MTFNPNPNGPAETAQVATPGTGAPLNTDGTVTVVETATPAVSSSADGRFTAADIEKARREEKDKLYSRLTQVDERSTALEAELAVLRTEREERLKAEADKQTAEQTAAKTKSESEMSAKKLLEERSTQWEAKFSQLQEERAQERALLEKEAEHNKLRAYIQEKVGAERANIAPELIDLVAGNTPEEIDASIAVLKVKTQSIFDSMTAAQQTARSQMRGVAATGFTGNGPTDGDSGYRQLSAEDIKNMPMSEFAKYRSQLLGAASNQSINRGLFD